MKSLNLSKPHLIVVVGIPGAGKTFFAQQFSKMFGAPYLRYEDLYEFSSDAHAIDRIWDFTLDKLALTKHTLVLEGPGATKLERRQISELARAYGYKALYIWVQTEPVTAGMRATKGVGKIKPLYPISSQEFDQKADAFEALSAGENYMVISGKHTYASQAKNVLQKLTQGRSEKTKLSPSMTRTVPSQNTAPDQSRRGRITIN
jgi:predicted kinase